MSWWSNVSVYINSYFYLFNCENSETCTSPEYFRDELACDGSSWFPPQLNPKVRSRMKDRSLKLLRRSQGKQGQVCYATGFLPKTPQVVASPPRPSPSPSPRPSPSPMRLKVCWRRCPDASEFGSDTERYRNRPTAKPLFCRCQNSNGGELLSESVVYTLAKALKSLIELEGMAGGHLFLSLMYDALYGQVDCR